MSALAVLFAVSMNSVSYANDCPMAEQGQVMKMEHQHKGFGAPHHKHFKGKRPSKAEMEAKKAEFEKRLNLTDEQKAQIEKNKQNDREKMKPIMQKMHEKRTEIMGIKTDPALAPHEKVEKTAPLEKDLIDLKLKANELRKKNMEAFEKLLTAEQKAEFEKIKEEQKQEMEKRRQHFKGLKKGKFPHPPIEKPVMPEPVAVEK